MIVKKHRIFSRLRRKRIWLPIFALFFLLAVFLARPAFVLLQAWHHDRDQRMPIPAGLVDDIARFDQTPIESIWDMPADDALAEIGLRALLDSARHRHLPVCIAGARHSMGGQTIAPHGFQINMLPHNRMHYDPIDKCLRVQTGARWSQVIPYLDAMGLSVAVMQSNNDFTVGGSLSVNCHGWPFNQPPIASTVRCFRIMLSDGSIKTCSRTENAELFSLVLGGYGLFGVLLDADLLVVPDERYEVQQFTQPADDLVHAWQTRLQPESEVGMALGRMSVDQSHFLTESLLYFLKRSPAADGSVPALKSPRGESIARTVFQASAESDYGKTLRWGTETRLITHISGKYFSRNQLLNESVEVLGNRTADTTDLLQEYFLPAEHFNEFLAQLRRLIPPSHANLLNVTVREIQPDADAFLRYADRPLFSLVLLYRVNRSAVNDPEFVGLTSHAIDAALSLGGRYYLPYRLDASPEQFKQAYPMQQRFFELKRKYDPQSLFDNAFYSRYGKKM